MIVENEKIKILGNRFKKHRSAIVISVVRMDKNKGLKNVCQTFKRNYNKKIDYMDFKDISIEWRNQNQHIKQMSSPISLSEFGVDRQDRSLSSEFKILTFMTQTQYHLQKLYQNPQQFPYNRNPHIMTFNPTKPILTTQEQKDKIQNYINANIVEFQGRKIIGTQGPLTSTFYNFYRMVEKYNITSVFMLCCLIQKNRKKCDRYWPNMQTQGGKMIEREYELTLISEVKQQELRIRKVHVKNHNNSFQTVVTHYQIITWPDGDRPLPSSKKTLDFMVKEFLIYYEKGEPPVVHCSAGVGRTGTFIAMALFKKIIEEKKQVSVFQTVRILRQQRWGMVYTFSQYEFLYEWVDQLIMDKKNQQHEMYSNTNSSEDDNQATV